MALGAWPVSVTNAVMLLLIGTMVAFKRSVQA